MSDTIVAISTAPGIGGIGIIRMSGDKTFEILDKIFVQKNKKHISKINGYTMKYGNILYSGKVIDEVLVSYFKAPKSYTTEDMCEINSHGGQIVVRKILEICLKNGAILAQAGEFTKRAFLNGRIDLSQAESVIDIINAKSERESIEGVNQLNGYLSNEIGNIKKELLEVISNIEVSIDYPEYDTPDINNNILMNKFNNIKDKLEKLEKSFDNGKLIRDGIKTAIIGKPNVGKSSLLNKILKEDRAIVTEYEGTTRDTIEEFVNINGVPLKLVDTAGIRESKDMVEKMGIEKSRKIAKEADLVIAIFDTSRELDDEDKEILEIVNDKKSIVILNKIDLEARFNAEELNLNGNYESIIKMSTLKNEGIDVLYDKIKELFDIGDVKLDNEVIITNQRHKNLISNAIFKLNDSIKSLKDDMPVDIIEISLRDVLTSLGMITGEEASEEIINEIFSRFCLGK